MSVNEPNAIQKVVKSELCYFLSVSLFSSWSQHILTVLEGLVRAQCFARWPGVPGESLSRQRVRRHWLSLGRVMAPRTGVQEQNWNSDGSKISKTWLQMHKSSDSFRTSSHSRCNATWGCPTAEQNVNCSDFPPVVFVRILASKKSPSHAVIKHDRRV